MRLPSQSWKGIAHDLQHFQTAYDRARGNTTREPRSNRRVIQLLKELIETYQKEKLESDDIVSDFRDRSRRIVAGQ